MTFLKPLGRDAVEYAVQRYKDGKTIQEIAAEIAIRHNKPGFDESHLRILMAVEGME